MKPLSWRHHRNPYNQPGGVPKLDYESNEGEFMYANAKPPRRASTAETVGCAAVIGFVVVVLCGLAAWVAVSVLGGGR